MRNEFKKPVKLELNNSGAWKTLGRFDAADDEQTALVLDAAETLVQTLNNGGPPKYCPTLRVTMDNGDMSGAGVLMMWELAMGWRDRAGAGC